MKNLTIVITAFMAVGSISSCNIKKDPQKKSGSDVLDHSQIRTTQNEIEFLQKYNKEVVIYIANEPTQPYIDSTKSPAVTHPVENDVLYKYVHGAVDIGDVAQLQAAICGRASEARTNELYVVTNKDLSSGTIRHCKHGINSGIFEDITFGIDVKLLDFPLLKLENNSPVVLTAVLTQIQSLLKTSSTVTPAVKTAVNLIVKSHGSETNVLIGCHITISNLGVIVNGEKDPLGCEKAQDGTIPGISGNQIAQVFSDLYGQPGSPSLTSGTVFLESCRSKDATEYRRVDDDFVGPIDRSAFLKSLDSSFSAWGSNVGGLTANTVDDYRTILGSSEQASMGIRLHQLLKTCQHKADKSGQNCVTPSVATWDSYETSLLRAQP